jgi:hypothetical protein
VCAKSAENLNQLLADTMTLRDLYKKHHWQVSGPTFYQLHLLFDKHFTEQSELVDAVADDAYRDNNTTFPAPHSGLMLVTNEGALVINPALTGMAGRLQVCTPRTPLAESCTKPKLVVAPA